MAFFCWKDGFFERGDGGKLQICVFAKSFEDRKKALRNAEFKRVSTGAFCGLRKIAGTAERENAACYKAAVAGKAEDAGWRFIP